MRTHQTVSVPRPSPLSAAIAFALLPGLAAAADLNRQPIVTQAAPSMEAGASGPFVVQGSSAIAPKAAVAGGVPNVFVTDTFLSLGTVQVGKRSRTVSSRLLSNGSADYVIESIGNDICGYGGSGGAMCSQGFGPDISCSTTCVPGVPYPPSSSCSFSASFSPTFAGFQSTYIPICDNAGGRPRYIDIQGQAFDPIVELGPDVWDFGSVRVGQRSDVRSFGAFNPSTRPADVGLPTVSGPFEIVSHNCTSPMAALSRCDILVQFVPTAGGPASGRLVVAASGPVFYGGPGSAVAELSGIGLEVAALDAPNTVDMGVQVLGRPPVTQSITITNIGDLPLTFTGLSTTAGFGASSACPAILVPGASCNLTLTFSADKSGEYSGALVISTDHGSKTIQLSGRTQAVPAPDIRVTPVTITFGDRVLGSASASQQVIVANVGTAAATISSITISNDYVIQGNTCGPNLSASTSCTLDLVFRPIGFGPRFGELSIVDNADGSPHKVNLGGNGCRVPNAMGNRGGTNPCSP